MSANVFGAISEAGRPLEVGWVGGLRWPQVASVGCTARRSRPRMSRRTLGDAHMFSHMFSHLWCVAKCASVLRIQFV